MSEEEYVFVIHAPSTYHPGNAFSVVEELDNAGDWFMIYGYNEEWDSFEDFITELEADPRVGLDGGEDAWTWTWTGGGHNITVAKRKLR